MFILKRLNIDAELKIAHTKKHKNESIYEVP